MLRNPITFGVGAIAAGPAIGAAFATGASFVWNNSDKIAGLMGLAKEFYPNNAMVYNYFMF